MSQPSKGGYRWYGPAKITAAASETAHTSSGTETTVAGASSNQCRECGAGKVLLLMNTLLNGEIFHSLKET